MPRYWQMTKIDNKGHKSESDCSKEALLLRSSVVLGPETTFEKNATQSMKA
jgi:hypothetical protein